MKNNLLTKTLFLGIICLFLLMPNMSAMCKISDIKSPLNSSEDLPDLKIISIKLGHGYVYWYLYAVVLNDGTGAVPAWTERTLRCVAIRPITKKVVADHTFSIGGGTPSIPPGETSTIFRLWDTHPSTPFGLYKVYFEVDPDHAIYESNENNNVVWAYFLLFEGWSHPKQLTFLHQVKSVPLIF
jgi:hypothetical protein